MKAGACHKVLSTALLPLLVALLLPPLPASGAGNPPPSVGPTEGYTTLSAPSSLNGPLSYPPDPTADIPWSPSSYGGVADIQAAFNNGRTHENSQLGSSIPMLTMPPQVEWDTMDDGQKALWLINQERAARGVHLLAGLETNVTDVAQDYADYLLANDATGHFADGHDPEWRLNQKPAIAACQDSLAVSENTFYLGSSQPSISLPLERAVYWFVYEDLAFSWGHRHAVLWYPYTDNSCNPGQEGFLGIGRASGGPYQGNVFAELVVMNVFDPCATWAPCPATSRYVELPAGTCNGLNPCYGSIGAAVAASYPGDTIYVFPGTYAESVDLSTMSSTGDISLVTVDGSATPTPGTATVDPGAAGGPGSGEAFYHGAPIFSGDVTINGFLVDSPDKDGIELKVNGDIEIANVTANGVGDGTGGDDGMQVNSETGDVTITACTASNNSGLNTDGFVLKAAGNVTISDSTASNNSGENCDGFQIDVDGDLEISRVTARGNTDDGIGFRESPPNKVTIQNVDLRDNGSAGLDLEVMPSASSFLLAGSIICGNAVDGLDLGADIDLNAEGNWWGSASGPYHAVRNPGGGGDNIKDSTSGGGSGTVDFDPWIETITGSVAVSGATATGSRVINFKFSGGGGTVFLGPGPGDPNSTPPFTLTTDNGTLTDSDETGATVHEFINQANGILSVTLNPATDDPATVTLDGPCQLDDQIVVVSAKSRVYLPIVLKNPRTSVGWTTIMAEDFEGTFPGAWTALDLGPGAGEYHWGKRSCRSYAGSFSGWAVGGGFDGAALNCGSNYPDKVESWMRYGPFSLTDATAADLTFQLWIDSEPDYHDFVYRGAAIDGYDFYGFRTSGYSNGWIERTLDLTNVPTLGDLTGQPQVWIMLVFFSDTNTNLPEGAYVDNIVLRKYVSSTTQVPPTEPTSGTHGLIQEQTWVLEVETDLQK